MTKELETDQKLDDNKLSTHKDDHQLLPLESNKNPLPLDDERKPSPPPERKKPLSLEEGQRHSTLEDSHKAAVQEDDPKSTTLEKDHNKPSPPNDDNPEPSVTEDDQKPSALEDKNKTNSSEVEQNPESSEEADRMNSSEGVIVESDTLEKNKMEEESNLAGSSGSVRATRVDNRREVQSETRKYFLSLTGAIRVVELAFACLIVTFYAYYCTYYDKKPQVVTPGFLGRSRETLVLIAAFVSGVGNLQIIIAITCSHGSLKAMHSSMFFFFFDIVSFILLLVGSMLTAELYTQPLKAATIDGLLIKRGLCFLAALESFFHLCGATCDFIKFMRKRKQKHVRPVGLESI